MRDRLPNSMKSELDFLDEKLKDENIKSMLTEVIYSALQTMKECPSLCISDAFIAGCKEWNV